MSHRLTWPQCLLTLLLGLLILTWTTSPVQAEPKAIEPVIGCWHKTDDLYHNRGNLEITADQDGYLEFALEVYSGRLCTNFKGVAWGYGPDYYICYFNPKEDDPNYKAAKFEFRISRDEEWNPQSISVNFEEGQDTSLCPPMFNLSGSFIKGEPFYISNAFAQPILDKHGEGLTKLIGVKSLDYLMDVIDRAFPAFNDADSFRGSINGTDEYVDFCARDGKIYLLMGKINGAEGLKFYTNDPKYFRSLPDFIQPPPEAERIIYASAPQS